MGVMVIILYGLTIEHLKSVKHYKVVKCQSATLNDMGNAFKEMGNINQADAMFKQSADVLRYPQ
jgi:hypothetical protein